jgi:hypothetical protein
MALTTPLQRIACPKCRAEQGKKCISAFGNRMTSWDASHVDRWDAARELGEEVRRRARAYVDGL